jgi:hypothetical protein
MKRKINITILFLTVSIVTGCATTPTLNDIPHTNEDFHRSYGELATIYPLMPHPQLDLSIATIDSQATMSGLHIPLQLLEDNWGESVNVADGSWILHIGTILSAQLTGYLLAGAPPIPIEIHAGLFGGFYLYAPFPAQTYTWVKGEYCIKARAVRNANTYYNKEVVGWIWMAKNNCLKNSG